MSGRVVLLGVDGRSTRIVYNYLASRFDVAGVVLETPVDKLTILRRRARRWGKREAASQAVFSATVARYLKKAGEPRIQGILREGGLSDAVIPEAEVVRVQTVNGDACRAALAGARPDVVVINGTRIIGKKTLAAVQARFVNVHVGITPRYRGVHGGYWALAEGDPEHAGVTVYFVDEGIDTGEVIAQARIEPTPEDTFATYPFLQLRAGLPLLEQAVSGILRGEAATTAPMTPDSKLWTHPTVGRYLKGWLTRGVR